MEENTIDDTRENVSTNIQNELIEESQSELKIVASVSGMNCAKQHESQDVKETSENTENDIQMIVQKNLREQSQFERSLLEYERIIPIQDCPRFMSGKYGYVEILTTLAKKTAYILHWLDGVNKAKDTKKNKPSILELLREEYNNDQSDSSNCCEDIQLQNHKSLDDNKFHVQNKCEENRAYYNEASSINNMIYCTLSVYIHEKLLFRRKICILYNVVFLRYFTKMEF